MAARASRRRLARWEQRRKAISRLDRKPSRVENVPAPAVCWSARTASQAGNSAATRLVESVTRSSRMRPAFTANGSCGRSGGFIFRPRCETNIWPSSTAGRRRSRFPRLFRRGGVDGGVHFHGLESQQLFARFDLLAGRDKDRDHAPGQRTGNRAGAAAGLCDGRGRSGGGRRRRARLDRRRRRWRRGADTGSSGTSTVTS